MILGKKKPAKKVGAAATARHYEVIQSPVITEKSTAQSEKGKFVFNVSTDASKVEVKDAVEALFNVKVVKVNTLNRKGKSKQFRGTLGRRPDTKKAVVTLEAGSSIDIAAGAR